MSGRFYIETLGCPKNQVDSDKLAGMLCSDGLAETEDLAEADLVVVNTCAFIEAAREESIETILSLAEARRPGARLVVTGCFAERSGGELAKALPEVDQVAGFGVPIELTTRPRRAGPRPRQPGRPSVRRASAGIVAARGSSFDLLELARPDVPGPWAYVKVAEGCDRRCGFCAIPSFRGPQRSRSVESILGEVEGLAVREIVLVAQDLASFGRDRSDAKMVSGPSVKRALPGAPLQELVRLVAARAPWVRLLYLYPSSLSDQLIETILETGVPYFDLSLQHASKSLLAAMARPGHRSSFLERIATIRGRAPGAALRSSFIIGYPGETEEDHDELLGFIDEAELDWAGFFAYSAEEGTPAASRGEIVPDGLVAERLQEASEQQDRITASKRAQLVGRRIEVLVESPGRARSYREAPEIDGIVMVEESLPVGSFAEVVVTAAIGPDLEAVSTGRVAPLEERHGTWRGERSAAGLVWRA